MIQGVTKHQIVRDVMSAIMSGGKAIAGHFAPGAQISQRNNAAMSDAPWFDRMEGDFRLSGETEAQAFFDALMKRTAYISYEPRGVICEEDAAASRCDWTRRDAKTGTLITGTTMYWFSFSSDDKIKAIESIGTIHSVIPSPRGEVAKDEADDARPAR